MSLFNCYKAIQLITECWNNNLIIKDTTKKTRFFRNGFYIKLSKSTMLQLQMEV